MCLGFSDLFFGFFFFKERDENEIVRIGFGM